MTRLCHHYVLSIVLGRKMRIMQKPALTDQEVDRIVEMAWEDRTTFDAIEMQFGLNQQAVIQLMRTEMKASSFRMWRKRTHGRTSKHAALRSDDITRFKCSSRRQ